MDYELDSRLQKLIGEHKINLMSPKGLLEISVATIEAVKAHLSENHPGDYNDIDDLASASNILYRQR